MPVKDGFHRLRRAAVILLAELRRRCPHSPARRESYALRNRTAGARWDSGEDVIRERSSG